MQEDIVRPHRSVRGSLRERKAALSGWVKAGAFTTSFIEEVYQGTAKQTRVNTIHNRFDVSRTKHIRASQSGDFSVHSVCSVSSDSSNESTKSLTFSNKARVFHQDARLDEDPVFEDLKKPNRLPPLEVRRYRASRHYPLDPSQPCSAAGRWLQSKHT